MKRLTLSVLIAITHFLGCGGRHDPAGTNALGPTAGRDHLTVRLSSPNAIAYTRASVAIQIVVEGAVPDKVDLLKNGTTLVSGLPAPYLYSWDTGGDPEGSYSLRARAIKGNQTFDSEAVTVNVLRSRPTVVSRLPLPGDSNVSIDGGIQATFSAPMSAGTLTNQTVIVREAQRIHLDKSLELSADGRTLTIRLATGMTAPSDLTVEFSDGVTDAAGNALVTPLAPWRWLVPAWRTLADDLISEGKAALTVNARYTIVATTINGSIIMVRRWDGARWEQFPQITALHQGAPALAIDPEGNPILAFNDIRQMVDQMKVVVWNGTAWRDLGIHSGSGNTSAPAIVGDNRGALAVAWQAEVTTGSQIRGQFFDGTSWSNIELWGSGSDHQESPSLAMSDRQPVLAWSQLEVSGRRRIHVARGSQWGSWAPIGAGLPSAYSPYDAYQPSVAVDASGTPTIAWTLGDPWRINTQTWTGTDWPAEYVLGRESSHQPALAVSPAGWRFLAWIETSSSLRSALHFTGTAAGEEVIDPGSSSVNPWYPSIAVDSEGKPTIAWQENGLRRTVVKQLQRPVMSR